MDRSSTSESTAQALFEIGDLVADREPADGNANSAVVVNCPPQQANEWTAYGETTVAEDNPAYPEDTPVVVIIYRSELKRFDPEWPERENPYPLTEFNDAGLSYYTFPVPRLKPLDSDTDESADTQPEGAGKGTTDDDAASDAESRMAQITHQDPTTTNARADDEASSQEDSAIDNELDCFVESDDGVGITV
jgi:hypothetical protein